MRREVRVTVPAKVNLHLGVGALRPDGFHELVTVFHAVDLVDTVTVRPAEQVTLTVTGEGAEELPADATNLAWRAAELYRAERGGPAVAIDLVKAIPVAGGMAGGSADAAAVLIACAALAEDTASLDPLAAELGSDVVFPLHGGTALGTGRGERVEPLPHPGTLHWVFALADHGISAGAAYGELDRLRAAGAVPAGAEPPEKLLRALASGDAFTIAAALHNDLEPAALSLHPELANTLAAGRSAGALAGIVSGSGPTCAFLCANAAAAAAVAAALDTADVCRATRIARGPAVGARPH
jgi:4-diphosphocytidyl-2-C-methyl-D-erythritol kinase